VRVWRICARKFRNRAFDGSGARLYGGRWNLPGTPMVYTASTLSLAALELFVNLDPEDLPPNLVSIFASVPDGLPITEIKSSSLPRNWRTYPASPASQKLGADWIAAGSTAILSVPSAVIPEERNFLLNPAHADFKLIEIGESKPFRFDPRMWKRAGPTPDAAR